MNFDTRLDDNLFNLSGGIIYYKCIPMWNCCSSNLSGYKFSKSVWKDGDEEENELFIEVTITCEDDLGDIYTYGMWDDELDCDKWLENPVELYNKPLTIPLFS